MAAQKKLLIEIAGTDNDGQYGTQSFKLPSRDDWVANLKTMNKKINKKFQVEEEYGLEINGQSVRYDDANGLAAIMKGINVDEEEPLFTIIAVAEVGSKNAGRKIVCHYNGQEFVYYIGQELSELDDAMYDEMYDAIKSAFKIKGKMGRIYESIGGKKIYCDDWDDLSDALEDKEEDEALDLYVEGKGGNASKAKNKGPGFKKKTAASPRNTTAASPTTQEPKPDLSENPLYIWCQCNGLANYFEKLSVEFEIVKPEELIEVNVSELADDLGLKYGSKNRFMKAVNVLRSTQVTQQTDEAETAAAAAYPEGVPSAITIKKHPLQIFDDDKKDDAQSGSDELYVWCKQIGISKFYDALRKHIESPSDFTELTATDISELCVELQIKFGFKSKFKKAIKAIQSQSDEKEEQKQHNEPAQIAKPVKPKRNLRGVVLVPCTKMEYKAPRRAQSAASIVKTVTTSFFSYDTKKPQQLNTRKVQRRVFKAPQHRIIGSTNNKVIMIVGQTGAGKTTLINSMMNFIYGVEYADPYRFRLIQEKEKKEAESQTDHVSTYHIKHEDGWRIPYDLTIIDTPGFGIGGIEKDKQITADIRFFFEKILDGIDGVCFVVKSTYCVFNNAFNNVLNLWAKDLLENIFVLLTFCDGSRPPVLDALAQHQTLRHCKVFRLNNSVYSEDPTHRKPLEDDSFDQMFWAMGTKCFDDFFKSLHTTKSINECREVLKQREAIQVQIEHISNSVDNAVSNQQNIAEQERLLKANKQKINQNTEVFHEVTEEKWVRKPSTSSIINCFDCRHGHKTCCKGCKANDHSPYTCYVMNGDNVCDVCGCDARSHRNASYYYEWPTFTKRVSDWDWIPQKEQHARRLILKKAQLGVSKSEMILKNLVKERQRLEKEVHGMIADILKYRNYLEKVALRPSLSTFGDYIDQLIQNEEYSPTRDNAKIKQLMKCKDQELMIQRILKHGDQTKIHQLYGLRTKK